MMPKFLFILAAVAGLAVVVDGFLIEPYRIEVTHSSVHAPLTRPLKIAHLSDLHTSGLGPRERKLLLLLDAEHPDVIVITGDTVTWGSHYDGIRPLLSRLHAPLGVWLVRGHPPQKITSLDSHLPSESDKPENSKPYFQPPHKTAMSRWNRNYSALHRKRLRVR